MSTQSFRFSFASLFVLSLILYGCSGQGEKASSAATEQTMKDLVAAWNSHDVEKILSFFTDDCVYEDIVVGKVNHGKEELRAFIKDLLTGAPDVKLELESIVASGDHVSMEWVMSGTQTGVLLGFPASGKSFSGRGVSVSELMDGKIKKNTDYYDGASFFRQLGIQFQTVASDPFVGTWIMNLAKSKFSSSPLKSYTLAFDGINYVQDMVDVNGKPSHHSWVAKDDGKDYPLTGNPDADMFSVTKTNPNTVKYVFKKNGKEVYRGQVVVSDDGKTCVDKGGGKDAKGQAHSYSIFEEKK